MVRALAVFERPTNSFPLILTLFVFGVFLQCYAGARKMEIIVVFVAGIGLSAVLHLTFDFPVHADDAHMHFWARVAIGFALYSHLLVPVFYLVSIKVNLRRRLKRCPSNFGCTQLQE